MFKEIKVKKAINGDEEAFVELIEEKKENLYRTAYAYVKNEQEALDIVQETVYKAYISINTLKKARYFNTWITKILINISINTLNKNRKIAYLENDINEFIDYECKREEKLDILESLDKINEKHREVIILKYFDDLTLSEISRVLDMPLGTVKTYLSRGIKKLREIMGEEII